MFWRYNRQFETGRSCDALFLPLLLLALACKGNIHTMNLELVHCQHWACNQPVGLLCKMLARLMQVLPACKPACLQLCCSLATQSQCEPLLLCVPQQAAKYCQLCQQHRQATAQLHLSHTLKHCAQVQTNLAWPALLLLQANRWSAVATPAASAGAAVAPDNVPACKNSYRAAVAGTAA